MWNVIFLALSRETASISTFSHNKPYSYILFILRVNPLCLNLVNQCLLPWCGGVKIETQYYDGALDEWNKSLATVIARSCSPTDYEMKAAFQTRCKLCSSSDNITYDREQVQVGETIKPLEKIRRLLDSLRLHLITLCGNSISQQDTYQITYWSWETKKTGLYVGHGWPHVA